MQHRTMGTGPVWQQNLVSPSMNLVKCYGILREKTGTDPLALSDGAHR